MDEKLELKIRREYAKASERTDKLCLWIKSVLEEIRLYGDFVHDFQIRQKTIDSLLRKIEDKDDIRSFEDIKKNVHDLVGARLIVYMPNRIKNMHQQILDSAKMNVIQVRIHYYDQDGFESLITSISTDVKSRNIIFEKQQNESGYFGVHYIIKPRQEKLSLEKFELQLRTLMNHAWSEVQHKAIYKGTGGTETAKAKFAELSGFVHLCDKRLGDLVHSTVVTPSVELTMQREDEIPERFKPVYDAINHLIGEYEQDKISSSDFEAEAERILKEYAEDIKELLQETSNKGYISPNLALAELYLKTTKLDQAYEIYNKCKQIKDLPTDTKVKILLRIGETLEEKGNIKEAENIIQDLEDILPSYDPKTKDHLLYQGIAMLSWRLGKYEAALDWGRKALDLYQNYYTEGDKTAKKSRDLLKYILNVVYYRLDFWNHPMKAKGKENPSSSEFRDLTDELQPQVNDALELLEQGVEPVASNYDTLAWYYYHASKGYYSNNDLRDAELALSKAENYYKECLLRWSRSEEPRRKIWAKHDEAIRAFRAQSFSKH